MNEIIDKDRAVIELSRIARKELEQKQVNNESIYLLKLLSSEQWWMKNLSNSNKKNPTYKNNITEKKFNGWTITFTGKNIDTSQKDLNLVDNYLRTRLARYEVEKVFKDISTFDTTLYKENTQSTLIYIKLKIAKLDSEIKKLINLKNSYKNESKYEPNFTKNGELKKYPVIDQLIDQKLVEIYNLEIEEIKLNNNNQNAALNELLSEINPLINSSFNGIILSDKIILVLKNKIKNEENKDKQNMYQNLIYNLEGIKYKFPINLESELLSINENLKLSDILIRFGLLGILISLIINFLFILKLRGFNVFAKKD
jgi:hypothetical protein